MDILNTLHSDVLISQRGRIHESALQEAGSGFRCFLFEATVKIISRICLADTTRETSVLAEWVIRRLQQNFPCKQIHSHFKYFLIRII